METKRKNPYVVLLEEIREHCRKIKYRHTKQMRHYPKARLSEGWSLLNLYERVAAAKQLGYDVVLKADDTGLVVNYVKEVPATPFSWE